MNAGLLRDIKIFLPISFLCGLLFFLVSIFHSYQELHSISNRIQEDITFNEGTWDTTSYNADPLLPGTSPIYVLASDGFVIERWKPIAGYLDASDFKHLLAFTEIQTIQTSSQQDWRIFSLPINKEGETHGVVTVSSYHPIPEVLSTHDVKMMETAHYILSHSSVENGTVTVKDLEQRKIPHYISFQVVNQFNKIVSKSNNNNSIDRLPNFIDPSYIATQLQSFPIQVVRDSRNGELFLVFSQPLFDENNSAKGIIVVGRNMQTILTIFLAYLRIIIFIVILLVLGQLAKTKMLQTLKNDTNNKIIFDSKNSNILIGENRIPIAYASNQYYLCMATILQPNKRWEIDELLEKFGEEHDSSSWRKIYDAMNQVNKKVFPILKKKLIILEEKTYRLNPELR